MLGIGIDTGGTYTDAVIYDMDSRRVLSTGKSLTTRHDLTLGIHAVLDQLDQSLLERAGILALSTTLATNAALEDTGSRAKALLIGMTPDKMKDLERVYASYGFRDLSQVIFMEGRPAHAFGQPIEPDWDHLESQAEEWFGDCAAVGVTQVFPEADGSRLERRSRKILEEKLGLSVTTAYELFDEVDVLKRGAGTFLNARLVPLIDDFLCAVKSVLARRKMELPVVIIRSDGSQMSEDMARDYPVETLLSGPASSAMGGSVLSLEPDSVLVDMGGTTTDIALIRDKYPVAAAQGISIGRWRTTVQGLFVDTFLLGGDSAVRYEAEELRLDGHRVVPLSVLAVRYPGIVEELRRLTAEETRHTRMLHEFMVLQQDVPDERIGTYSDREADMIRLLRSGPLPLAVFAERSGGSLYRMGCERLEAEGILIRSGLTPTDMMICKGDFPGFSDEAARLALCYLSWNVREKAEEIPDLVYKLVIKKMYCNIVRILLDQKYPAERRSLDQEGVRRMVELAFEEAYRGRMADSDGEKKGWMTALVKTDLPLVGVGAPIAVFLPRVAELLGTRAVIPENASVANALGAIASHIVTRVQVRMKAKYEGAELVGFSVFDGEKEEIYETCAAAEQRSVEIARREVLEKSVRQGSSANPDVRVQVRQIRSRAGQASLYFESVIEAVATDVYSRAERDLQI